MHIPQKPSGLVVFAHGGGSGMYSPRNQQVALRLNEHGLATLLVNLLTIEEEKMDLQTRQLRFNIDLLSKRLIASIEWIRNNPDTQNLNIGLFGASTGAAAALVVAAQRQTDVKAIVSRGGRPDLAGNNNLREVQAPTLLLVGENDEEVLKVNECALKEIGAANKKLTIIPGATHLFEEEGKLEEVARIASGWFRCFFLA